uniref:Uncharacterized protein n=1 Tax=Nelumbo nucifera TaxID=4432 RepID=A0A822ZEZ6_NELNU|nr:TPA_asm: hypothetical protein HUJ06_001687 [Nelumbo nucifera]
MSRRYNCSFSMSANPKIQFFFKGFREQKRRKSCLWVISSLVFVLDSLSSLCELKG